MKNELLSLLKSFSKAEIKRLEYFLRNPFFSHNKNLITFFECLISYYPTYTISKSEKIILFKKVYGNAAYNDSSFRSLFHLLLARVKDFIVVESSLIDNKHVEINYLKFLNERGLIDCYEKNIARFENALQNKSNYYYSEELLSLYEVEVLKFNFSRTNEHILHFKNVNAKNDIINKSKKYLSLHYFIEMVSDFVIGFILKDKYNLINNNSVKIDDVISFKLIEQLCDTKQLKNTFSLYLALFQTFKNITQDKYYFEYKNKVLSNIENLSKSEVSFHITSLISNCLIKKNLESKIDYSLELWQLYSTILKNNLYSNPQNPYLDIWLYRAILFLGLKLQLNEDVFSFIYDYSNKVCPNETKNIHNLSLAYYYYENSDLNLSLNHAKRIKITNFVLKYDIKNLLIKIYYELEAYDSLECAILAYRGFLKNDKILNINIKIQFKKFLKYTEKLYTLSEDKISEIECLYYEIQKSEGVYSKDWLLKMYSIKIGEDKSIQVKVKTTEQQSVA